MVSNVTSLSKVPGGGRVGAGGVFCLGLAAFMLGCSEDPLPTLAGKAHVRLYNPLAQDIPYVINTGGEGSEAVETDRTWEALCNVSVPDSPWMKITRKVRDDAAFFHTIWMRIYPESSDHHSVLTGMNSTYWMRGWCPVTFERTPDDPTTGIFTMSGCEINDRYGASGRVEFAQFHARYCSTEPLE